MVSHPPCLSAPCGEAAVRKLGKAPDTSEECLTHRVPLFQNPRLTPTQRAPINRIPEDSASPTADQRPSVAKRALSVKDKEISGIQKASAQLQWAGSSPESLPHNPKRRTVPRCISWPKNNHRTGANGDCPVVGKAKTA